MGQQNKDIFLPAKIPFMHSDVDKNNQSCAFSHITLCITALLSHTTCVYIRKRVALSELLDLPVIYAVLPACFEAKVGTLKIKVKELFRTDTVSRHQRCRHTFWVSGTTLFTCHQSILTSHRGSTPPCPSSWLNTQISFSY